LAVIGVFIGWIYFVKYFEKIRRKHVETVWLRGETQKFIVRDFSHAREQLPPHRREGEEDAEGGVRETSVSISSSAPHPSPPMGEETT
ncbi:hypothetical protein ACQ1Z3_15175, partial [Enterococcus faecalis]|uniref:hypothetical protein n=1 Tax=Enterococcus faecalis TaxID=1351 RepID=UPI003D6B2478